MAAPAASSAAAATLQRQCACGQYTEGQVCEDCKKHTSFVQRSGGLGGAGTAPPIVHEVLHSAGQPLMQETRAWAEPLFGRNFSHVRVHTDAKAAESARSVNALAYTVGPHLVFGTSRYSPMSPAGRKLLAHELAHTVQQGSSGTPSLQTKLEISRTSDAAEHEAEAVADQAATGRNVRVQERTPSIVHRISRETIGNISLGAGVASAGLGVLALATGHGTLGAIGLGLGAIGVLAGLKLRSKPKPVPTSIRVAQIHQFPLAADSVSAGLRSGLGGVAEIEVSNGNVDYDGSDIEEHFVGGDCQHANVSGVGGTGGSTFTVGYGFTNRNLPVKINLPPKHNVFYDQHLFASLKNDPPPRPCAQQYTFDGQVIAGKTFVRRYDAISTNIDGENVMVCTVDINEQAPAPAPVQQPATAQPGANPAPAGQSPAAPQGN